MTKVSAKVKRYNVYSEQMMAVWKKYTAQSNLIGESFIFKKHKWFKTSLEEKILSDTWIECSYNIIDKNNVITRFSNTRIREFDEFDSVLKAIQKTVLTKPDSVIEDFSVSCQTSYIIKPVENQQL